MAEEHGQFVSSYTSMDQENELGGSEQLLMPKKGTYKPVL